jgi:hypothetical protein
VKLAHICVAGSQPLSVRTGGAVQRRIVELTRAQVARGHRVVAYSVGPEGRRTTTRGAEDDLSATLRNAVVALSQSEAKALAGHVRGCPEVIPNDITGPRPAGERGRHPERTGRGRLLYIWQLIPLKNPDLLLHALADVRRSVDIELRLVYNNAWQEATPPAVGAPRPCR